jgi:hypothetical protein
MEPLQLLFWLSMYVLPAMTSDEAHKGRLMLIHYIIDRVYRSIGVIYFVVVGVGDTYA